MDEDRLELETQIQRLSLQVRELAMMLRGRVLSRPSFPDSRRMADRLHALATCAEETSLEARGSRSERVLPLKVVKDGLPEDRG